MTRLLAVAANELVWARVGTYRIVDQPGFGAPAYVKLTVANTVADLITVVAFDDWAINLIQVLWAL
jgi:hypothetical protein